MSGQGPRGGEAGPGRRGLRVSAQADGGRGPAAGGGVGIKPWGRAFGGGGQAFWRQSSGSMSPRGVLGEACASGSGALGQGCP